MIVHQHLDAFNARDTGALLATLTPDVVWVTGQDTFTGLEQLRALFSPGLWELAPSLALRRLVDAGEVVAAELVEELTVDGAVRNYGIAVFFTVRDGLISAVKVYREGSAEIT